MTNTVEVRGHGDNWKVNYPNEERLSSPFPVYDKEGNYKQTLWCGSDTTGVTEAHFTGTETEAVEYAKYLLPGCEVTVTRTLTKQEALAKARQSRRSID